jgi:uncharacterized membrane protein affecting hemolysin expression
VLFFILGSILMTANQYTQAALIKANPQVDIMQMTLARGAMACFLMLLWLNKDTKKVLYD